MITPPQETYYVMDMFDHGYAFSLDKIATEVYGRTYCGQQTGDMISNDTTVAYDFSTESDVLEWVDGESYRPAPEHAHFDWANPVLNLVDWLAEPDGEFDFEHERLGPEPRTMLAHLIRDGHLPYGKYLINVSW